MLWENELEVDRLNLKMSQLLSGSFESPIQVTLLLMCWGRNKLDVPWNDPTVILDDYGNRIYLGVSSRYMFNNSKYACHYQEKLL